MLKYLVVQLADNAVSYCHYNNNSTSERFISINTLKAAIYFGMVENLNIQFVYPHQALPEDYNDIIETIDHTKIMPCNAPYIENADIVVCNSIAEIEGSKLHKEQIVILRISHKDINEVARIYDVVKSKCTRCNIVITDMEKISNNKFDEYKSILVKLGEKVQADILDNSSMELNLLTDRLALSSMNNCNAGDEVITLMPNGKFYPCAGFYYDNSNEDFGDLMRGVEIKNKKLFKLEYAPICRHCDAYQCKRCTWLNRKTTLEVNTPSHEQCVYAHLERNASRELLKNIRKYVEFLPDINIEDITYLDPFDKRLEW